MVRKHSAQPGSERHCVFGVCVDDGSAAKPFPAAVRNAERRVQNVLPRHLKARLKAQEKIESMMIR